METEELLATYTCDSSALCCAYSDASKLIVAGDVDGNLLILRLEGPKAKN